MGAGELECGLGAEEEKETLGWGLGESERIWRRGEYDQKTLCMKG